MDSHLLYFKDLFPGLFIFVRVVGFFALVPGFSEAYVSPRIRALLAATVTLVLIPLLSDKVPVMPDHPGQFFMLLGAEVFIGAYMGLILKLLFLSLETAGSIISMQSSLSNVLAYNPTAQSQSAIPSVFLGLVALMLVFTSDIHHYFIQALVDSYNLLPPAVTPDWAFFTQTISKTVSFGFELALKLSAPFIVGGMVMFLGLGLVNRLMTQVQIFFISQPLQLLSGLIFLALTIKAINTTFITAFLEAIRDLLALGGS